MSKKNKKGWQCDMWWIMLIKLAIVAAIAVAVGLVGEQLVKRNNTKNQQENNQDIKTD